VQRPRAARARDETVSLMTDRATLCGFHALSARLRQNPDSVREIYHDEHRRDARMRALLAAAEDRKIRLIAIDLARLDGMAGHARHQGIVARIDPSKSFIALEDVLDTLTTPALLLVLDGVQDPRNLGACLRVADAMGVDAVIAPKDRAVGVNATVAKAACGAAESVPFIAVTNLARSLRAVRERGIRVVGATEDAANELGGIPLQGAIAWVLGSEDEGLRRLTRENCDELARIPMLGTVESLNVSVAAGICLFETVRQRGAIV